MPIKRVEEIAGWITTELAGSILGVTERRVRRLAEEGQLRALMIGAKTILVSRRAVEHRRQQPPASGRPRVKPR